MTQLMKWRTVSLALAGMVIGGFALAPDAQGAGTLQEVEGQGFTAQLATVSCPPAVAPSAASFAITWGDNTSTPAQTAISGDQILIDGSHAYGEEGTDDGTVSGTYDCGGDAQPPSSTPFTAQVADAALSASGHAFSATVGQSVSGIVATFTDADPGAAAADYTAMIDWGDGSSSAGTVSGTGNAYSVTGSHTYASAGSDTATVRISDQGGSAATATTPVTVEAAPPAGAGLAASFTLSPTAVAGSRVVTFDAAASRQGAMDITGFDWTVNGAQLANCAGATSQLRTSTLPVGTDTVALTVIDSAGASATATHTISVTGAVHGALARVARTRRLHDLYLPIVAECLSGPGDPTGASVAPDVPGAPGAGCTTQIQSGIVDAVGCNLQEYQDTVDITTSTMRVGYGTVNIYGVDVAGPDGLPAKYGTPLPGVSSVTDSQTVLDDVQWPVEQQLGGVTWASGVCKKIEQLLADATAAGEQQQAQIWANQLQQDGCLAMPGGSEQTPTGVGAGSPLPTSTGASAALFVRPAALGEHAARARLAVARSRAPVVNPGTTVVQPLGDACSATAVPSNQTYAGNTLSTVCLDLWVCTGPVRLNGIDYDPGAGGELVIVPQFDLVISQSVSESIDGLALHPGQPPQPINYELPSNAQGAPGSSGQDFPALSIDDLQQTIAQQPASSRSAASQIIDALSAVGGFPSIGGLQVSFDNDVAIISFQVKLPDPPFTGSGGPVTAQVVARVGPTEPFHVEYGYLGNTTGGGGANLGPVALKKFGVCFRQQPSTDSNTGPTNPDPNVDPCPQITGIDDSGVPGPAWFASGEVDITGAVDVLFRPGPDFTSQGCSGSIPLGFVFSNGSLTQAGGFVDVSNGGIPIVPGVVSLTGFGGGFAQHPQYETFGGCMTFNVVSLLNVAASLFGVDTSNGYRYTFASGDLSPCSLPKFGGSYPYTDHLGLGACGSVSLTLPGLDPIQVAQAYALYVDDPGAVFFGGGLCFAIPAGGGHDCHNPPGTGLALDAGVDGAIGFGSGTPFDFEGHASVVAKLFGLQVFGGSAQALVSRGPGGEGGIGVCAGVDGASVGMAYPWHASIIDVLQNDLVSPCGDAWLAQKLGVNVQAAAARAGGHPGAAIRVPAGLQAVNVDVRSALGLPAITVVGPHGERATSDAKRVVRAHGLTLIPQPALHEILVSDTHPKAGIYRIVAAPGSPRLTEVQRREAIPVDVRAH
ncbi:MAG: hypothetical protein ACYC0H_01535, partial [Solirubrobacteraceae bacterium]